MTDQVQDRYTSMTGPLLTDELVKRELPTSGRVDELRARLREDDEQRLGAQQTPDQAENEKDAARIQAEKTAQNASDTPDETPEGEETDEQVEDAPEVPEPREPRREQPYGVVLTEDQARVLNAGTASMQRFTKHVSRTSERKYAAGDQVIAIGSPEDSKVLVLPFGVEIELTPPEDHSDGLQRLREANDKLQQEED